MSETTAYLNTAFSKSENFCAFIAYNLLSM